MGEQKEETAKSYSDFVSLKKYLEYRYGNNKINVIKRTIEQTGTSSEVLLDKKAAATISDISKTETYLKVLSSNADAGLEGAVIIAHYLDQDLVPHTAVIADAPADLSTVGGTDFDTAVEDFYCWDIEGYGDECFTVSEDVGAGLTLDCGPTGTGNAQIIAAATKGTKLSYLGVGSVYGRLAVDHADGAGFVGSLDYYTPIFSVKSATCTLVALTTTEVLFLDSDGFPIQDFYRPRNCKGNKRTTANTGAFLLTDADCGNANGSSNDVWGGIAAGELEYTSSRYFVAKDTIAFVAKIKIQLNTAAAAEVYIYATEEDETVQAKHTIPVGIGQRIIDDDILILETDSEFKMGIKGDTGIFNISFWIFEVSTL